MDAVVTGVWVIEPQMNIPLYILRERSQADIEAHQGMFPPALAPTNTAVNANDLIRFQGLIQAFDTAYQNFDNLMTSLGQVDQGWLELSDSISTLYGLVLSMLPEASTAPQTLDQTNVSVAGWLMGNGRLRRMTNSILAAHHVIDVGLNHSIQGIAWLDQAAYELCMSDHLPVVFTLSVNPTPQQQADAAALFAIGVQHRNPSAPKRPRPPSTDPTVTPKRIRLGKA